MLLMYYYCSQKEENLKGEERDTNRQNHVEIDGIGTQSKLVRDGHEAIHEEIEVLEEAQHAEVRAEAEEQPGAADARSVRPRDASPGGQD